MPWNRSHTACLRGPTTAADRTSAPPQSSTSTGSPKQTGTDTSPPPKSSTEAPDGCVVENTWKARTYTPSRPPGRYTAMFNGDVIERILQLGPGARPVPGPVSQNHRPSKSGSTRRSGGPSVEPLTPATRQGPSRTQALICASPDLAAGTWSMAPSRQGDAHLDFDHTP